MNPDKSPGAGTEKIPEGCFNSYYNMGLINSTQIWVWAFMNKSTLPIIIKISTLEATHANQE